MTECEYCNRTESCSMEVQPGDYVCTREEGHEGPCVACTIFTHDITGAIGESSDD